MIDGCIGECSSFDNSFDIYAHACGVETPVFPNNWEDRAKNIELNGVLLLIPSMEDIAISKYIANREKDREFIRKMWREQLLDYETICNLTNLLPMERDECQGLNPEILKGKIDADCKSRQTAPPARCDFF